MPIEIVDRYTRAQIKSRPMDWFVFGDNMARKGTGGQARECRGEPNTIGIVTKLAPGTLEEAYFTNDSLVFARSPIDQAFADIREYLQMGFTVVWPRDGVGTGLAELPARAPKIMAYIEAEWQKIVDEFAV